MKTFRAALFLNLLLAALTVVTSSFALQRGANGWFHTGDSVRKKTIVFAHISVYAIGHDMKEVPKAKSKRAVIDLDVGKRFTWRMMRDVGNEKIRDALKEAYAMNGYHDAGKINAFVGAFRGEIKENQYVTITYDSEKKATTIVVQGQGSATVQGIDFMKATWSIWFGKIDQDSLGDDLISKL